LLACGCRRYFGSPFSGASSHLLIVFRDKLVIRDISRIDFPWRWYIRLILPIMAMVITPASPPQKAARVG
jgi:hypothetical protein